MTQNTDNPAEDHEQTSEEAKPQGTWARLREKRWFRWSTDIAFFFLIFFAVSAYQTRKHVNAGEIAPPFTLQTMDGKTTSTQTLAGKPTVIVFWAPWCTVCGAESGTISSLRSYYRDRVNVVSVALGYTRRTEVQKFIDDHKVDYPVLLGHRGITQAYRIEAFPTLYILDSKGQITHSTTGFTTLPGLVWRLFWVS